MARFARVLTSTEAKATTSLAATAAPPPEAVTLESDFVVVLAVLLCALICVVGLIAAARCAFRRRNNDNNTATNGSAYPQHYANKGLKKKVLQSLPKFTYTTTMTSSSTDGTENCVKLPPLLSTECPICLAEFVEGEEVRMLPNCGHAFHVACIDKWLGSHSSCPSCRQVLVVGKCGKCGHSLSSTTTTTNTASGGGPVNAPPCATVNNTFLP